MEGGKCLDLKQFYLQNVMSITSDHKMCFEAACVLFYKYL